MCETSHEATPERERLAGDLQAPETLTGLPVLANLPGGNVGARLRK